MENLSGVAINLTKGEAQKISVQKEINLKIDEGGNIFLNEEKISLSEVASKMKNLLIDEEKSVNIFADKNVAQGLVTSAMLEAKSGGAKHFSLIVKKWKIPFSALL